MPKQCRQNRSHGSPGSSHKNAITPEGDIRYGPESRQRRTPGRSRVSGEGGERDKHHTHDPRTK
jgi:hypothetical protein